MISWEWISNIECFKDKSQVSFYRHLMFSGLGERETFCKPQQSKKRNCCFSRKCQMWMYWHSTKRPITLPWLGEVLLTWCYILYVHQKNGKVWLTVGTHQSFAFYNLRINVWIWNTNTLKWQLKKTFHFIAHFNSLISCLVTSLPGSLGLPLKYKNSHWNKYSRSFKINETLEMVIMCEIKHSLFGDVG